MFIDACCTIGTDHDAEPSAEELLKEMDRAGIDKAVINPPDRCFAWDNELGNDLKLKAVCDHANRFIPTVTVNPWRSDAPDIVEKYIEADKVVLAFSPGPQGFVLSDNKLDAILEKLTTTRTDIPVYIHTGHHSHAAPSQLALLAGRFPQLNFIMGHCGATDYHDDVASVCELNKNVYIESSFARPPSFIAKLETIGYDRGIFGSGFPYNQLSFEWSQMLELLSDEHKSDVLGANMLKLLEGDNAC